MTVSESLPRPQEDAKWLITSSGAVRIVLLMCIRNNIVLFEKRQLTPPNAPPLTPAYIGNLQQNAMPLLVRHATYTQKPYSLQEVEVTANNGVAGAPMILPLSTGAGGR
ncbi:hypothetical protein N7463_008389 [Penicillium fimorum]|uniref:Uncharacterized protein n=1 Tax=Penicillium fimorum TaxID=1882269 RepID=A0A9X0C382_9EURO|nr:hypothetical protein N7463_008389 [Penicillium fimorum]